MRNRNIGAIDPAVGKKWFGITADGNINQVNIDDE